MARDSNGTGVAVHVGVMARRVTALFAMIVLVALLVVLVWRVYLHHQHGVPADESAVVALDARFA